MQQIQGGLLMWNNAISDILIRLTKIESKLSEKGLNTLTVLENQNKCLEKFNERIEGLEIYIFSVCDILAMQKQIDNHEYILNNNRNAAIEFHESIEDLQNIAYKGTR